MSPYRLVEPLPSAPTAGRRPALCTSRTSSSNSTVRQNSTTDSLSIQRMTSSRSRQPPSTAGGIHTCTSSEFAIFSFDEELEYELRREKEVAPVFHVGRSNGRSSHDSTPHYNTSNCNYTGTFTRKQSTTLSIGSTSSTHSTNSNKATWTKSDLDSWQSNYKHISS